VSPLWREWPFATTAPLHGFPRVVEDHESDAELKFCQARVASERLRFAFGPSTAHDEVMGHSCERCGRPGNPRSIDDPTAFGMLKSLNLCVQCRAAIDKWTCVLADGSADTALFFETQELPFSRPINRVIVGQAPEDREPATDKES
jgi:hypothetical protein